MIPLSAPIIPFIIGITTMLIILIIKVTIVIIKHIIKNIGLVCVLILLNGNGFLSPTHASTSFIPAKFLVFSPLPVN